MRKILYSIRFFRIFKWSGWRDSNPRPLRPERSALPDCATARSLATAAGKRKIIVTASGNFETKIAHWQATSVLMHSDDDRPNHRTTMPSMVSSICSQPWPSSKKRRNDLGKSSAYWLAVAENHSRFSLLS